MIHARLVSPPDTTAQLVPELARNPGVVNLTVTSGIVRRPEGDSVEFDLALGAANEVIARLRELGIDQKGSIVLDPVTTSISATSRRAIGSQRRFDEFAPVWENVDALIRSGGRYPPSWYALLMIAGLIAAVGLLTNSEILIVGAMVVGPEYSAIVAGAYGTLRRDGDLWRRSVFALVVGFAFAILATLLLGLLVKAVGIEPSLYSHGLRPVSDLINSPNWYSVIVAVLAGIVGVISLTESRVSTLIGVFISVTTIPAAADIGLSIAFGSGHEAWGSLGQLLLNITLLGAMAIVGIPAQRALWNRVTNPAQ